MSVRAIIELMTDGTTYSSNDPHDWDLAEKRQFYIDYDREMTVDERSDFSAQIQSMIPEDITIWQTEAFQHERDTAIFQLTFCTENTDIIRRYANESAEHRAEDEINRDLDYDERRAGCV